MRSALSGPAGAHPGARAPSDSPNDLVRPNTLTAAAAGAFAAVVLSSSAGLLAVSGAFMLSRANAGSGWAQLLFWLGLGLIMLPASARLYRVWRDAAQPVPT